MAIIWNNSTATPVTGSLSATDGFVYSRTSGALTIDATSTGLSGNSFQNAATSLMIWNTTQANQNFFSTSLASNYDIGAGSVSIFYNVNSISNFTVNSSFSGAGAAGLQASGSATASVMTVTGSLLGMNQIQSYSPSFGWNTGFRIYARGTLVVKDMSRQMTYSALSNETMTIRVDAPVGASTTSFNSTLILDAEAAVSTTAIFRSSSIAGAPAISFGNVTTGSIVRTATNSANAASLTFGGVNTGDNTVLYGTTVVAGALSLAKVDTGKWVFAGNNSAISGFTFNANSGTVGVTNNSGLGSGALSMQSSNTLEVSNGITLSNTLTANNAVTSVGGNNSLTGLLTLGGTTAITNTAAGTTLTINNGTAITGSGLGLTIGGAGNVSIAQAINTTSGTVTKNGTGTATLSSTASGFTGKFILNDGLVIASQLSSSGTASSIGAGSAVDFAASGIIRYTGASSVPGFNRTLVFSGATAAGFENNSTGNGALAITGSATATGTNTVALKGSSTALFNIFAPSLGNVAAGFAASGSGRWIVTGGNDLTGNSTVASGSTLMAASSAYTSKLLGGVTVNAGGKVQTGSDSDQKGRCSYNGLTFAGTLANKARLRIGGSAISPTVLMSGNLVLPTSGTMEFDLSADTFKTPGTYTLIEFSGGAGVTGGTIAANTTVKKPTGFSARTYTLAYTGNLVTVTVA